MSLTGNKGEWSEIYVFLKLLAEGRLNAADENLDELKGIFYPILQIIREEKGFTEKNYRINGDIKIVDASSNKLLLSISKSEFICKSIFLFDELRKKKKRSFSIPEMDEFLSKIDIHTIAKGKSNKSDITLVVHDLKTGLKPTLGFSIKSLLGKDATLFNAGKTTNFIYRIDNVKLSINDINLINSIKSKPVIKNRLSKLRKMGAQLVLYDIESENLKLNLQLIDSQLPEIIGHLLILNYEKSLHNVTELLEILKNLNPLNYNLSKGHPFYEYKIKSFLTDSALGMTPSALWKGKYDATGGIIVVKDDGNILCYHIYNRNEFQDYLLNNTRFEQASTTRYKFGSIYSNQNNNFLKLNLQIRFTK
jgi:hypothetical protein